MFHSWAIANSILTIYPQWLARPLWLFAGDTKCFKVIKLPVSRKLARIKSPNEIHTEAVLSQTYVKYCMPLGSVANQVLCNYAIGGGVLEHVGTPAGYWLDWQGSHPL